MACDGRARSRREREIADARSGEPAWIRTRWRKRRPRRSAARRPSKSGSRQAAGGSQPGESRRRQLPHGRSAGGGRRRAGSALQQEPGTRSSCSTACATKARKPTRGRAGDAGRLHRLGLVRAGTVPGQLGAAGRRRRAGKRATPGCARTSASSEWESVQRSITNAHYTDPPTVMAMWNMVQRMGFDGWPRAGAEHGHRQLLRDDAERAGRTVQAVRHRAGRDHRRHGQAAVSRCQRAGDGLPGLQDAGQLPRCRDR